MRYRWGGSTAQRSITSIGRARFALIPGTSGILRYVNL